MILLFLKLRRANTLVEGHYSDFLLQFKGERDGKLYYKIQYTINTNCIIYCHLQGVVKHGKTSIVKWLKGIL